MDDHRIIVSFGEWEKNPCLQAKTSASPEEAGNRNILRLKPEVLAESS